MLSDFSRVLYYKYLEIKTGSRVDFGWAPADHFNKPAIISYYIDSKNADIASIDDYNKYFFALVGQTAKEFISSWGENLDLFVEHWKSKNHAYTKEQAEFLYSLSYLLQNEKEFIFNNKRYLKIGAK